MEDNTPKLQQPEGETKRLSGLAIGAGIAGATAVGATAGVLLSNLFGKKHYDIDDSDLEPEPDPEPKHEPEPEPKHEDRPQHHEEDIAHEKDHDDDHSIIEDDINGDEIEIEPLGWYVEEGPDGEDVYIMLLGDPNSGAALMAIAESVPGSGVYDVVLDLTQDPIDVQILEPPLAREDMEMVVPNPYTDDDIDIDDIIDDIDDEDKEEVIDDDDEKEDDEIVINDNDEKNEDDIIIEDDINGEDIDPDAEVYGPDPDIDIDDPLPEIEEPYNEDIYPEENIIDDHVEPIDDTMM